MKPLVSVITPVLNAADTLELTLLSVSAQTYSNIEHIVIDGGSTDGTVDILQRFQSSAQLRWQSEPDSGMYSAINKGIALARGGYISYLNADDLYLPWSVEKAVSVMMGGKSEPRLRRRSDHIQEGWSRPRCLDAVLPAIRGCGLCE